MHKDAREELGARLKFVVLEYANHFGVTKACREFNVPRSTFYRWKQKYDKEGRSGLYRKKSPSHIATRARHLLMLLKKSWNSVESIK
jgi:transposase